MTSTFDYLGTFYYWAKQMPDIRPLIEAIYDEAVKQCSKVEPKTLSWDNWKHKDMYMKIYGEFGAKAYFLQDVHTILDHGKYHFKCVDRDLDWLIHKIYEWIDNRNHSWYFIDIRDLPLRKRKKYKKILDELKKLVKSGFIKCYIAPNRVNKKWLES